jgi:hypothetical protein
MSICVPVLTPGQCGSSLLLEILEDFGFHAPAGGERDIRHPYGYHDEMCLIKPQIDGEWETFVEQVVKHSRDHERWAFKLQSGALLWHERAISVLPNPRLVYYDRENRDRVLKKTGNWATWFYQEPSSASSSSTPTPWGVPFRTFPKRWPKWKNEIQTPTRKVENSVWPRSVARPGARAHKRRPPLSAPTSC